MILVPKLCHLNVHFNNRCLKIAQVHKKTLPLATWVGHYPGYDLWPPASQHRPIILPLYLVISIIRISVGWKPVLAKCLTELRSKAISRLETSLYFTLSVPVTQHFMYCNVAFAGQRHNGDPARARGNKSKVWAWPNVFSDLSTNLSKSPRMLCPYLDQTFTAFFPYLLLS